MENRRLKCPKCFFSTEVESKFIKYYVLCHRLDPNFSVMCNKIGCGMTYRNWDSFRKHLYRNHQERVDELDNNNEEIDVPENNEENDVFGELLFTFLHVFMVSIGHETFTVRKC